MSSSTIKKQPERLVHLDLLRLLAIFFVIFNHTGNRGYSLFAEQTESFFYIPYMLVSVFCKIAVPLFFMISGALLLNRDDSLKQLFTKRVARMVIVLIVVSVPYYFWLHRPNGMGVSDFLSYIYGSSASTSLWYLYSYIGLLLVLPFLQKMVKNLKAQDYVYLLIGHIILIGIIPCLEYLLWDGNTTLHQSFSAVMFTTQNIFYALMGYYLERVIDQKHCRPRNIWLSVLFSVFALMITCLITADLQSKKAGTHDPEQWETFFNCFICIPTMSVYFIVKQLALKITNQRFKTILRVLGSAVFGVYLIEKILRSVTSSVYSFSAPLVGSLIASLIWSASVLIAGLIIVVIVKHIPFLKKVINKFI